MSNLVSTIFKLPRENDSSIEATKTFLSTLLTINKHSFWKKMVGAKPHVIALEIGVINQQIKFIITCSSEIIDFIQTQLGTNYPLAVGEKITDPLSNPNLDIKELNLSAGNYYPINTFDKYVDVDPLASVLSILSKATPEEVTFIQIAIEGTDTRWQTLGEMYGKNGTKNENGTYSPRTDYQVIKEKISISGFKSSIRILSTNSDRLKEITSAFNIYSRPDGNSFSASKSIFLNKRKLLKDARLRKVTGRNILNISEISTLWHLPNKKISTLNIDWGKKVLSEPPENLPSSHLSSDEERSHIAFFGKTDFKNENVTFGIKDTDRRRHVWAIGKTGTGKSTLIANMAIDDLKKDRGLAVIDPHGDLCEVLLDYIPKHRINDVIYFNPADKDFPIVINPLEVKNKEEAELVVSGLMSIFTKIWNNVWSARMEYILRNCLMTLSEIPNTTLKDVLSLLTDKSYRNKIINTMKDESLKKFWTDEFEQMTDKLRQEAISPILNKVGQFVTSPLIRSIIGSSKSSINLDDAMNNGKIIIANLSQGRLGEDNASLLGAMLITKLQLSAMHRVDIPEDQRRDFYLYVDEFQNFATGSFIKIISEARKYRLDIMLANQYMAQLPEDVTKAILGNAGSIITFAMGASDADILQKEFAQTFTAQDLINLSKYQIAVKLTIDGQITRPFVADTLPLPTSTNQNRETVIKVSRERYTKNY